MKTTFGDSDGDGGGRNGVQNVAPVVFEYCDPLARDRPVQFEPIRRSLLFADDPQHHRDSTR
jgi:hypothetical protein